MENWNQKPMNTGEEEYPRGTGTACPTAVGTGGLPMAGAARGCTVTGGLGGGEALAGAGPEDPLLPLTAKYTAAATTTTIPTTIPTFAHVCWLRRSAVRPTARSRTNSTASVAPAASASIRRSQSASERASRACTSAALATSGATSSELSSHSSVMGGATVPNPSAGSSRPVTGTRTVAHPKASTVSSAIRLEATRGL